MPVIIKGFHRTGHSPSNPAGRIALVENLVHLIAGPLHALARFNKRGATEWLHVLPSLPASITCLIEDSSASRMDPLR